MELEALRILFPEVSWEEENYKENKYYLWIYGRNFGIASDTKFIHPYYGAPFTFIEFFNEFEKHRKEQ